MDNVRMIIEENARRNAVINERFNPITGEGGILSRTKVSISDFPLDTLWLPDDMLHVPLVKKILKAKSIRKFYEQEFGTDENYEVERLKIIQEFIRIRCRFDFCFWAAMFVFIKNKGGGEDVLFRLNRPQRRLIERLERMRLNGKPIRLILLKARQWGGSTATQIYMAWLQLVHRVALNSLIVGHVKDASIEVKDMFDRMIKEYPVDMLHQLGDAYTENEPKLIGVGKTGNIYRIPQRKCKIKIGTAEMPNSARGGDYNLVHCTEVGLWKATEGKTPEDIVRSACSGVLYKPYTMIVYESTANGTGNFFHREYIAAKNGESQFEALFIPWYEIEWNTNPIDDVEAFAKGLYDNREVEYAESDRQEAGKYLWHLWEEGATLEAINWYISERSKYTNHGDMASECPTDDIEAFTFSGKRVFSPEDVEQFRKTCRPPKFIGEVYGKDDTEQGAFENLRFKAEQNGRLWMWQDVEKDGEEECLYRYLVVVDVCKGRTEKADYSVIAVIDRLWMMEGENPTIVAQWYGHIDMDLLAWKAAQIAAYYNNALLVIESNTLETNNTKGEAEYILNVIKEYYDNLYARKQSAEDIKEGAPRKYGFHTNTLTKKVIINNLKMVLREQLYTERDERCLDEYNTYIETEKGGFEAMEGHHDDILMTRAIGLHICLHEMEMPTIRTKTTKPRQHKSVGMADI